MEHDHECGCGCEHHDHEHIVSKVEQAFGKYQLNLDDEQVKKEVANLLAKHREENNTVAVKKLLLNSVELTTLKTDDSEEA